MGTNLDAIFDEIRTICTTHELTFAQVVCESFFIFDDDFEETADDEVVQRIREYSEKLGSGDELQDS